MLRRPNGAQAPGTQLSARLLRRGQGRRRAPGQAATPRPQLRRLPQPQPAGLRQDPATAEALYETLIDDPAVYPAYYIGYLEILELRDTAEELLGEEYTAKAFHQFLMEIGPAQFEIIEERMLEWIEEELSEAA